MYDCNEKRECLRFRQFLDVNDAIMLLHQMHRKTGTVNPITFLNLLKPKYVKSDFRWQAMINSVLKGNTEYST